MKITILRRKKVREKTKDSRVKAAIQLLDLNGCVVTELVDPEHVLGKCDVLLYEGIPYVSDGFQHGMWLFTEGVMLHVPYEADVCTSQEV